MDSGRIKGIYLIKRIKESDTDYEPRYYVGQAGNLFDRLEQHCTNNKQYIDKEIQKYGRTNFIFRILEEVSKDSELNSCETKWIEYYKSKHTKELMYNLSQTGNSNPLQLSKEIKGQIKELFKQDISRSIYAISERYEVSWKDVVEIRKKCLGMYNLKYDNEKCNIICTTTGETPDPWNGYRVTRLLSEKILQLKGQGENNKDIARKANISITDLGIFLNENGSEYTFANDLQ